MGMMTEDTGTNVDIHHSAKALLLEAAEKSGLLREVASLLWWADKLQHAPQEVKSGVCPACELLNQLTDAFDEHIAEPYTAAASALKLSEGFGDYAPVTPEDKAEAAAFVG
jgi:hypothetical protein